MNDPIVRVICIVLVFCLGYYFGRQSRTATVVREDDPADYWKNGGPPPAF